MKKEPNKKAVDLFLIIGFALFFGLIGRSVWRKMVVDNKGVFVMYFDESLQGLSEGAPIVFQGVEVGKVTRIKLVADAQDLKFQVPVYARLKPVGIVRDSFWEKLWGRDDLLESLIDRGLRARLTTQSFLTGQLMIELVMLPNSYIETKKEPEGESFPQIPTVLSKTEELSKGLDPMQISNTVTQINRITETLSDQLPVLLPSLSRSSESLNNVLLRADDVLSNANQVLFKMSENTEETISNLNKTLQDLSDAAKSLQNLTDYLEQYPEALIKGKKGE